MRGYAPASITSFVGRSRELQALRRLLASARLITLVGPGGCGKTRLAVELVSRLAGRDVVWAALASIAPHEDPWPVVARALGAGSVDRIAGVLARRAPEHQTLLVLDNCEHVVESAAEVAVQVLTASARTQIIATSREPLDVEGELVWRVPSLSMPDLIDSERPEVAGRSDSVRLFVERARLATPTFALDATTCASVVAVCRAVDGIPLGIELAAARLRSLTVGELARHLDELMSLLVGTRRGDPRHRALHAAIDWSYSLLIPTQQALFRRLSIFRGGFTPSSAAAVCGDVGTGVGDTLLDIASLVDKSLVVPPAHGDRYRLLEPIREYAGDRLDASGEAPDIIERCASYLVDGVMSEVPDPMGMGDGASVRRVSDEFSNLAGILPWLVDHRPADALRVLARFAQNHWGLSPTHGVSVMGWLTRALETHPRRDATRVEGLLGQVQLTLQGGSDVRTARGLVDEAVAISAESGDTTLYARALSRSAFVAAWTDPVRALREYDEAIALLRTRHQAALALALAGRAVLRQRSGDPSGADADIADSLAAWERHSGMTTVSRALTLAAAADVAFQRHDLERAVASAREALRVEQTAEEISPDAVGSLVAPVEFLAHLAALQFDPERALRLAGFADRMREESGAWPRPWFSLTDRTWLIELEGRLGRRAGLLRVEGRRLSPRDAIALALGKRPAGSLSARELAVSVLVAEGLSDKEIAARLLISERTAESHVQRIREKLNLRSRAQIARWSAEQASLDAPGPAAPAVPPSAPSLAPFLIEERAGVKAL